MLAKDTPRFRSRYAARLMSHAARQVAEGEDADRGEEEREAGEGGGEAAEHEEEEVGERRHEEP